MGVSDGAYTKSGGITMNLPHITQEDIRHAMVGAALVGFVALNAVVEQRNAAAPSAATGTTYAGTYKVTAYCIHGITASGMRTGVGTVAAAHGEYAFGTQLVVEGYGRAVVRDRGGAITPGRLDVWFASCRQAINWGVRYVRVWVQH